MSIVDPRQFWLVYFETGRVQVADKEVEFSDEFFGPPDYQKAILPREIFHVIEYSALEAIQAEVSRLKSDLALWKDRYSTLLNEYNEQFKKSHSSTTDEKE